MKKTVTRADIEDVVDLSLSGAGGLRREAVSADFADSVRLVEDHNVERLRYRCQVHEVAEQRARTAADFLAQVLP